MVPHVRGLHSGLLEASLPLIQQLSDGLSASIDGDMWDGGSRLADSQQ